MNQELFGVAGMSFTGWSLIGYAGALMFSCRWIVQVLYSHRMQATVLPRPFWYMSMAGSMCLLAYFMFGATDMVGVLSNMFPLGIAAWNLIIDYRRRPDTPVRTNT